MSATFNFISNTLYDMCLVLLVSVLGDVALNSCNGNIHNLVCDSLPPFHTNFLL